MEPTTYRSGGRPAVHARRVRPEAGPLDRRRLIAAVLSAALPGLGQLANGRRQLAAIFLLPSLILLLLGYLLISGQSVARLAAWVATPGTLGTLLTLNVVILVWRLVAVGQAFLDTRWAGPTSRVGIVGILLIALAVVVPHGLAYVYGTAFRSTFAKVFDRGDEIVSPGGPGVTERLNVLLLGIDKLPWRPATLTDTMMVVSIDPVGETASMVSVPRDLIGVPLGNGDTYGPKLNSLMHYADTHPDDFPDGGIAALREAIGALLGIDIQYSARMDFYGFVEMVDAVGGVDVKVAEAIHDPTYDGFGLEQKGYSIEAGTHHLDGLNALAYARARKAAGESDFTRAARQQQILIALRDAVTKDGSLLWELPDLLAAAGDTVTTDVPVERLPQLAAVVDDIQDSAITRAVIRHPLVKSKSTRYGSSLIPDLKAIRAVAADLFPPPGQEPIPWPTPKPTKTPKPSPSD